MTSSPYTPETLAGRWQCSPETVRQLCKANRLGHFRLGRLYRIKPEHVEEYECQTLQSDACEAASASTGSTPAPASEPVISLRHAPVRKRKPRG
ncbi:helix-turn-helix domain-containing protein [Salipiger sp. 1_MG-2023]|uniref:helix-turn-helix domain-containing protein n=1 Tax=Salipiger sp. 1_MG-2023 TaxID=3062665 RepID=UPI0034C61DC0